MKKRLYILLAVLLSGSMAGCADFLDETPDKSGSAYIYHMDQLYGLMGNYNLYKGSAHVWAEIVYRGDAIEFSPYFVINGRPTEYAYEMWAGDNVRALTDYYLTSSWTIAWNSIYSCNTVLEYMDVVVQTTPEIRKQVEAEALFGRAYWHFILLVQYALWDDDTMGIGYRNTTLPDDIPARETVGYTLKKIYEDLDRAETLMTEAGRVYFELKRNFRPSLPAVKAIKARVDLYRGNYTSALANANAALAAYDYLLDFKKESTYEKREFYINRLDETDSYIVDSLIYFTMPNLGGQPGFAQYQEFYLPHEGNAKFAQRLPVSQSHYNLFDHENDERWKTFYNNHRNVYGGYIPKSVTLAGNTTPTARCFTWADQQGMPEAHRHTYYRFPSYEMIGKKYILGPTTAEMYLIKAECLARAGNTAEAAATLKTLRRARFTTQESADNIGGTLREALEEREREMGDIWRFYDIKRLNGADDANIRIRRTILTDMSDINSTKEIDVGPDDSYWVIPIPTSQLILMGWQQNPMLNYMN